MEAPGPNPETETVLFTNRNVTTAMPGRPQPLVGIFATVVLDGTGSGQANIGPTRPREHWQIAYVTVTTNQPPQGSGLPNAVVNESHATAYLGASANPTTQVSQTTTGSSGDACGMGNGDIQSGMQVWVKWSGGDAGQTATMNVFGTYTIGSPGV